MKSTLKIFLAILLASGKMSYSQQSVQIRTTGGTFSPGQGPSTASAGPITMYHRNANNNWSNLASSNPNTNVTFSLANQQYTGFNYTNISTGLVFGAQPTNAALSGTQSVGLRNIFEKMGAYPTSPGGATSSMFDASLSINFSNYGSGNSLSSTGFFSGAATGEPEANGGVFLFTCAQRLFDIGSPYGTNDRYYYGDLVINFNRFVSNPILHIAGLGGSYRYFPVGTGGNSGNPNDWRSAYFSTELEIVGFNGSKIAGNPNLVVPSGTGQILNGSSQPNGGSVSPTPNDIFDDYGAASGSVRVIGTVKTLTLRVYLRGSDASQFGWSALASASGNTVNPVTGDIWSVSVTADATALIPLPSTGVHLDAALNGNNVQLSWKTQTEINTKDFEIERSADGTNFTAIGTKNAAGNSTTETSYSHLDPNMTVPVYYYRLKMNDIDSRFTYSNIAIVRKSGDIKGVRVFPNPASHNLNLQFSNAKGNYTITLYNQAGQEVMAKQAIVQYDVQTVTVERGILPAGYYMINIRNINDGTVKAEKVIFQ